MPIELTDRQRRLIDAARILLVLALGFIVVGDLAGVFYAFGDVLLLFFLAWLLAFALMPVINRLARFIPRLPQAVAALIVYLAIIVALLEIVVQASASLATSIGQFIRDAPQLSDQLGSFLASLQDRLAGLGFKVDLVGQAPVIVANLQGWAGDLVGPLQSIAVASIGVFGNILILVILSIYMAVDKDRIMAFLYRLVPPSLGPEAHVVQSAVSRSFGGFLRGQLILGIVFGVLTAFVNIVFGLQYAAVTTVAAGLLQMIPFFGPFISWLPPVAVALVLNPSVALPVLVVMGIAWFVTMNILQPRLMAGSVGIHPIVVLASVVIGSKIAGVAGAIFGIPIAAVLSALFFQWFSRSRESGSVADRAAQRVASRQGREVRRPREPIGGIDEDLEDVARVHAHAADTGSADG